MLRTYYTYCDTRYTRPIVHKKLNPRPTSARAARGREWAGEGCGSPERGRARARRAATETRRLTP